MQIKICVIVHFNFERVLITVVTHVLNDGKCNPITLSDATLSGVATLLVGQSLFAFYDFVFPLHFGKC